MDARGVAELKVKKCNHTKMSVLMSLWNNLISQFHTSARQHFRGLEIRCGRGRFYIQRDSLMQHSWPACVEGIKIKVVRAFLRFLFPARCVFCISMFVLKIYNGSSNDLGVFTQSHTVSAIFIFFFQICVTLVFCPCWDGNVKVITNKSACLSLRHVAFCLQPSRL